MTSTVFALRASPQEDFIRSVRPLGEKALANASGGMQAEDLFPDLRKDLLKPIAALPYQEYRALVGLLTNVRKGQPFIEALQPVRERPENSVQFGCVIEALDTRHGALYAQQNFQGLMKPGQQNDAQLDVSFATDAIVLARLAYPLGVYINDAQAMRTEGISTDQKMSYWLCGRGSPVNERLFNYRNEAGWIDLSPRGNYTEVSYYAPGSGRRDPPRATCILEEGGAVLAGNQLKVSQLMGQGAQNKLQVVPHLITDNPQWSRAALLIVRDGTLHLFDRGSRSGIAGADEARTMFTQYAPDSIGGGAEVSFGQSQCFRLK